MNATSHSHSHTHSGERRLMLAFALTLLTLVVEAVGGWYSGSLALLADAGHMFVDAFALLLAWGGAHFARLPADQRRSFGYARLEVLVGYTNALTQIGIGAWIVFEALLRLGNPTPILSGVMLAVALAGLVVNAVLLQLLGGHAHDDLNTASARLHVFGDLLGSLGAVVAALIIRWQGWLWADPAISLVVALLIIGSAWRLLHRSAHILLEGTPDDVDASAVVAALRGEAGIVDIHHLHIWQLAGGRRLATLHVRIAEGGDAQAALLRVQSLLRETFRIMHATVQVESRDCIATGCSDGHAPGGQGHGGHGHAPHVHPGHAAHDH